MTSPVFEEFDPASDCDCPGCVHWRRVGPPTLPGRFGGHPAARGALVVAAAASAALGAGGPAVALTASHAPHRPGDPTDGEPDTPQGTKAPLHGPAGKPVEPGTPGKAPTTTRTEIINRAKTWVAAQVPYSMDSYWSDGYRQDCSGYVSMAWALQSNEWTGSLDQFGVKIKKDDLQPGDILLFHNPDNPEKGSHVVIFGGWTDYTHTYYTAYEQTPPHTRRLATPYAYWSNSDKYVPYRYKGLAPDAAGAEAAKVTTKEAYPGATYFGPGADNKYVTLLGRMLVGRGAQSYYTRGPGSRWSDADRLATQAFQRAQGWTGANADGLPGPGTWELLATGKGKDIPGAGTSGTTGTAPPAAAGTDGTPGKTGTAASPTSPASHGVPGYPGRNLFRPGADNPYVTQLGKQLVKKGYGRYYTTGPGSSWGDSDRRAVEAFQRDQGWRGGAADGYPGPETWRRLFA
ncbi:peptidoglycan-binding protein [Streptomyces olivochromogenes]|uniref:peptidoglycan-binding protein n=1 Tax=Streptomyces olivochromogenes TaxID=1963 RepID=UPI001F468AF2|nr:peptidoglycan-binding protein [Streptomyces olivochromogenes]MCF3135762.1 peptidoglycan-binding protein [Streptomyces olivochromogenes]